MEVNTVLPIKFEKITEYKISDTRFTKAKITVLHTGLNLNNSIFNKETVENAIPSICNTPILGFIEDNDNGDPDFSDHRSCLEVIDGKLRMKYKGIAYGVIPESCNPRWEKGTKPDGSEVEYLCVDGLLWNKFEDATEIFNRDYFKDQSMELSDSYEGYFDKDGHFVFTKFLFDGCCCLGNGVQPAMTGAKVEINFALSEIQSKLEQFNNYFSRLDSNDNIDLSMKGGCNVVNQEVIDNILAEYNVDAEHFEFEITDSTTEDEFREKVKLFSEQNKATLLSDEFIDSVLKEFNVTRTDIGEFSLEMTEDAFKEFVSNYVQTHNAAPVFSTYKEKRTMLCKVLPHEEKYADDKLVYAIDYWIADLDDSYVYVEKEEFNGGSWSYEKGRMGYTITDMFASITSEFEPMIVKWITTEEALAIEKNRATFEANEKELERLKQFEKETLAIQRTNDINHVFNKFDEKLCDVEAYKELKANCSDMSVNDIELQCYALVGKIATNFSAKPKDDKVVKITYEKSEGTPDDDYGGILSSKYGE